MNNEDLRIIEECIPIINESAINWSAIANALKNAAEEYKDKCLEYINLEEIQKIAYDIHKLEESLFNKLNKLKI